ncbi:MAG: TolC family outer membrane protein [Pseudomonadota bacterium]
MQTLTRRFLHGLTAILALGMSSSAWSAPGLLEVLNVAREHDSKLAAAEAARRAGQEALPQARAALWPQMGLTAGINRAHRNLEPSTAQSGTYSGSSLALVLRQPLFDRQKWIAVDQAESRVALSELDWLRAEQDLMLRVAEGYTNAVFAEDVVDLARAKIAAIAEQRLQAEHMYKGGIGTVTDIHEAQARYDLAVAEELAAQSHRRNMRQALFTLTGRVFESLAPLNDSVEFSPPQPEVLEAWVDAARNGSLEIQGAELQRQIAQFSVESARSQGYPVLDAVVNAQRLGNTDTGYDKDETYSAGVQLSLPVLTGGRLESVSRQASARLDQAMAEVRLARSESEQRVVEAFHGVVDSGARIRALRQAVRSSEVALDAARIGLQVGYRTGVDVLNAQHQLFTARRDLQQARYAFVMYRFRLAAAVGALGTNDVAVIDNWLKKN